MPLSRQIHRSPHISHKGGHGIEYLYTGFEGEHKVELGQKEKCRETNPIVIPALFIGLLLRIIFGLAAKAAPKGQHSPVAGP